ncbi:hypothetical protein G6F37_004238 [Rhizopus arrhizus]|nr:hypothetical protein G6F38_002561 [Rhizopus arrhizus]KAG1160170.1 hypothetical protein G6F37_004238 [Rhizopus arrhizus]
MHQNSNISSVKDVLDKIESLNDRFGIVQRQLSTFEDDVKPTVSDLEDVQNDLNGRLNSFQELRERNNKLEQELERCLCLLTKDFLKKRMKYERLSNSLNENKAADKLQEDIKNEIEHVCHAYNKKMQEWKNYILEQMTESRQKDELIIEIGDETRRYIKETFEKSINRLYQFE